MNTKEDSYSILLNNILSHALFVYSTKLYFRNKYMIRVGNPKAKIDVKVVYQTCSLKNMKVLICESVSKL